MRFLYTLPLTGAPPPDELTTGAAVGALAAAAERAGFEALGCLDHPAPSERWRQAGGHDALDPYVTLAYAASATRRIRLVTYLSPLPYRNPFLLAKTVATLDRLSGGRFTLGLGVGYLRSEYAALGADFERRNESVDEAIEVLLRAWSGLPVSYEAPGFTARDITCMPRPLQRPHPPLWIGGNSGRARERVAIVGDGWMPMPNPAESRSTVRTPALTRLDELVALIDDLRRRMAAAGREGDVDVVYPVHPPHVTMSFADHLDAIDELGEAGVTWAVVHGCGSTVNEARDWLVRYGSDVIERVKSRAGTTDAKEEAR